MFILFICNQISLVFHTIFFIVFCFFIHLINSQTFIEHLYVLDTMLDPGTVKSNKVWSLF